MFSLAVDLRGVDVLAVGGGPVSARRIRAFLAEGARVTCVAPVLCGDLHPLPEGVTWHARELVDSDLDRVRLVHTATGDREVDARVAALAEARGLWCVNASSAHEGTAAVPARAEVDTPSGLVSVAVNSSDPVRSVQLRNRIAHDLRTQPADLRPRREHSGWVALVGGGPGDAGLLTARALTLLHTADVVVIDRLAPQTVLDTLDPDVIVVDVGKSTGHHPVPQAEINRLLVEHARAGRGVVRLKGGDPFVLGRGGEEREVCEAAGVPCEVVPGVTSALSVPAAAGIPVTHRGVSKGFSVVSGHEELPWLPIASAHTVIILMGVSMLRQSVADLVAAGRDPLCPAAIIERGWLPDQRVTCAPLGELADAAEAAGVGAPAVVVIGDVVTLGPDWARNVPAGTS